MERKLASVQRVSRKDPIGNSDFIELITVQGWKCVAKKDEFRIGDLCVYFEIDSLLPIRPEFEFLRKFSHKKLPDGTEGFRIKSIRIRGELSQGVCMPLSIINGLDVKEGDDVSEYLGVTKYEPPPPSSVISGDALGLFSGFVPKTDEERLEYKPASVCWTN